MYTRNFLLYLENQKKNISVKNLQQFRKMANIQDKNKTNITLTYNKSKIYFICNH